MRKWLSREEIKRLRKSLNDHEQLDKMKGRFLGIRNRALVETLLQSGLRASELRALRVGDLYLDVKNGAEPYLKVLTLKRRRQVVDTVVLTKELAAILREYIKVMELYGKPNNPSAYLFPGRYGDIMSLVGLEEAIKQIFKEAQLPAHFSCHSLRHTHGFHLYNESKNLKLVQLRLRHSSISASGIYVGVPEGVEQQTISTMYA